MEMFLKRAYAEIHLDRARRNMDKIKSLLKDGSELAVVVKANAYGHDDESMALCFQEAGVRWFAVSNIHEAQRLRRCGIQGEILILGYTAPEYAGELSKDRLISTVVSMEHAEALSQEAVQRNVQVRCHGAVDSGMGRIGVPASPPEQCAQELTRISRLPGMKLEGIFTHFACADSGSPEDQEYTRAQRDSFLRACELLKQNGVELEHCHFCNSAGGTYYADGRSTLARFGVMLYGLCPNPELELPFPLEQVMELKAEVSQVKWVEKGAYLSYGRTYQAQEPRRIATVTIGYADGYSRLLSSKGEILLHGKRAPVVGRVCMDQLLADVTGIPEAKAGDIATLIGQDGLERITADDLAARYGTIGYEVVCGISKRIPRIIMDGDKILRVLEY